MTDHSQQRGEGGETDPVVVLPFPGLQSVGMGSIPESSPSTLISPQPIVDNSGSLGSLSLADSVERELAADGRFAAFLPQVAVSVDGDSVQLTGTVPTAAQKQSLLSTVRAIPGVGSVADSLSVG